MQIEKNHNHRFLIVNILLIIITLFIFWRIQDFEFITLDDSAYVTENPYVLSGFTKKNITGVFTDIYFGNWHPLTLLSHMLDYHLYGLNPKGHHFNNLLFHILNTLILLLLFTSITRSLWQSAIIAGLFAIHPMHVEPVAWISSRKDLLSAFFGFLSILYYCRYTKGGSKSTYFLSLLFFLFSLMSKAILVTLPALLLLLDYWPLNRIQYNSIIENIKIPSKQHNNRKTIKYLLLEKSPFFFFTIIFSIIAFKSQRQLDALPGLDYISFSSRISNAIVSYLEYINKTIWPIDLSIYYPHPGMHPLWQTVISGLVLAIISLIAVKTFRSHPYFITGWLWFLIALLPVIGIIQIGSHSMADRYSYISLIGLFTIFACALHRYFLNVSKSKMLFIIFIAALFLFYSSETWKYLQYWRNSITIYERALNVTSDNVLVHYNLGVVYASQENYDKAITHYKSAIRINPNKANSYNNLGNIYAFQGRYNEAIIYYNKSLLVKPDNELTLTNIGNVLSKEGRLKDAINYYMKAIDIKSDFVTARNNLGLVYSQIGCYEDAINQYKKALEIKPDNPKTHYYLGMIYSDMGNNISALKEHGILVPLNHNLADILMTNIIDKTREKKIE